MHDDLHNSTDTRKYPKTKTTNFNPAEKSKTEKSDRVRNNTTSSIEIVYTGTSKMFL